MEHKEFCAIINEISYKPGFSLGIKNNYDGSIDLTFQLETIDAVGCPVEVYKQVDSRLYIDEPPYFYQPYDSITKLVQYPKICSVVRIRNFPYKEIKDFKNKEQVLNLLLCEVIEMERHEALEFFKYKGTCVQSPHY